MKRILGLKDTIASSSGNKVILNILKIKIKFFCPTMVRSQPPRKTIKKSLEKFMLEEILNLANDLGLL